MYNDLKLSNNIDLLHILDFIKDNINVFDTHWAILFIDAIGTKSVETFKFPDDKEKINKKIKPNIISWNELIKFSSNFDQIIEICIIGCYSITSVQRYGDDSDMKNSCDIVIEVVDSSYIEISCKDFGLFKKFEAKFI